MAPPNGIQQIQVNPADHPANQLPAVLSRLAAAGAGPGAPGPGAPGPGAGGPGAGSSGVTIDTVIDDLHDLAGQMDDQGDKQTVLKCLAALQAIKATEQKENESLAGTTGVHRAMARAAGSY